jgi:hypothetical protein
VLCTAGAGTAVACLVRLNTRPKGHYDYTNWQDDVTKLLASYNIFDAESRETIIAFLDKYLVGYPFKKYDTTTRTKLEDGSVFTLKGSKVVQFPSGLTGLVDAYLLQQMKGLTELVPVAAAFYYLVAHPYNTGEMAIAKVAAK